VADKSKYFSKLWIFDFRVLALYRLKSCRNGRAALAARYASGRAARDFGKSAAESSD
jgi:hypothetical protein